MIKWYANKCVLIGSTHAGVTGTRKLKRFDSKTKTFIEIICHDIITEYNKSMGGVELADMLLEFDRITIITKR